MTQLTQLTTLTTNPRTLAFTAIILVIAVIVLLLTSHEWPRAWKVLGALALSLGLIAIKIDSGTRDAIVVGLMFATFGIVIWICAKIKEGTI